MITAPMSPKYGKIICQRLQWQLHSHNSEQILGQCISNLIYSMVTESARLEGGKKQNFKLMIKSTSDLNIPGFLTKNTLWSYKLCRGIYIANTESCTRQIQTFVNCLLSHGIQLPPFVISFTENMPIYSLWISWKLLSKNPSYTVLL